MPWANDDNIEGKQIMALHYLYVQSILNCQLVI